jgi:hypothetical protein
MSLSASIYNNTVGELQSWDNAGTNDGAVVKK